MYWTLSKWLAAKTDDTRDLLVASINTRHPAINLDNCKSLISAHSQFLQLVEPVYTDPIFQQKFAAFLPARSSQAYRLFRSDSGSASHTQNLVRAKLPQGLVPRIGWLYAATFVDRGLAQLSNTAQLSDDSVTIDFEENSRNWKSFKAELDQLYLSEAEEGRLVDAVRSALCAYCKLLKRR